MEDAAGRSASWWGGAAWVVLRRPSLWATAIIQAFRLARPGWWRTAPFLPVPPPDYLAFRLETQYGSGATPAPADVVTYLHWCREFRQER